MVEEAHAKGLLINSAMVNHRGGDNVSADCDHDARRIRFDRNGVFDCSSHDERVARRRDFKPFVLRATNKRATVFRERESPLAGSVSTFKTYTA
jgi:hypothetical protein